MQEDLKFIWWDSIKISSKKDKGWPQENLTGLYEGTHIILIFYRIKASIKQEMLFKNIFIEKIIYFRNWEKLFGIVQFSKANVF